MYLVIDIIVDMFLFTVYNSNNNKDDESLVFILLTNMDRTNNLHTENSPVT